MRVVITGGAGFLGSHLAHRLVRDGDEVLCLDNFLTGSPSNVGHLMPEPGFRLVRTDVTDYVHVVGEIDAVLHFASPASPVDYLRLPIHTLKVGSIGTLHALGLAREKRARFVLASTSARRLRRGEALLRGVDDGLPADPWRRHRDRPDLQHVRAADASR